jgi:hypothetical protein
MKQLVHNMRDSAICIYEYDSKKLRGSFFKEKPETGDVIMSHNKREANFLRMFEVTEIIENRNANISSDCSFDPTNAYFILGINEVAKEGAFAEVDNSIQRLR